MTTKNHAVVKETSRDSAVIIETSAKNIVLSCVDALNKEEFRTARTFASDDMVFEGVLDSRNGADAYFKDMEKMKFKYAIKKAFEEGDDVCLLYDLDMSGLTIFGCGWYHVKNGKINSVKVVFDPRPVLEQAAAKKPEPNT
ncbi:nuclear transport factor 2 family protein [Flavitalea flava]